MRKELDDLLCERYPAIFRDRHVPLNCMHRGFECGEGWFHILDALCAFIAARARETGIDFKATQVKEKLGSLRFRCLGYQDEAVHAAIQAAWERSLVTCEHCGEPGRLRDGPHRREVACPKHAGSG